MKNETKEMILEFLSKNVLNETYTIAKLYYSIFAEQEFSSFNDMISKTNEFYDFLIENSHLMKTSELTINQVIKIIENSKQNVMNFFLNDKQIKEQKMFTESVCNLSKSLNAENILDVGPGANALSSIIFAKHYKRVTAMDSRFFLSLQALKNLNICPLTQYFDDQTDVSGYDLIVGSRPCSAIEPIVRKCVEQKKPYIILLCGCELPAKDEPQANDIGWKPILEKIDPNIRFYKGYAFNIDLAPEEYKSAIINMEFVRTKSSDKLIPKLNKIFTDTKTNQQSSTKSFINSDDALDFDIKFE